MRSKNASLNHNPLKFQSPVIWIHRVKHDTENCYFCQSYPRIMKVQYSKREQVEYFECEYVKPAELRSRHTCLSENHHQTCNDDDIHDEFKQEETECQQEESDIEPHFINQADFDDLVRDLGLPKTKAELLASRLQQWKLVAEDFRVTSSRKRSKTCSFDECFETDEHTGITYAVDVYKLFDTIGCPYNPDEWRLFIDGSVNSLKAVLLHNGNMHPSVPIVYGTGVKETYDTTKAILQLVKYNDHQ